MFTALTLLLGALALVLPLPLAAAQALNGTGTISVLNHSSWASAEPSMAIGCIDDTGRLTADTCGNFTFLSEDPYSVYTSEGNCSFLNTSQVANTNSSYGDNDYAFYCWEHEADTSEEFYTVDGFDYLFMCQGDVDCYYDLPSAPEANDTLPFWQFSWGGSERTVPAGHLKAILLWVPSS